MGCGASVNEKDVFECLCFNELAERIDSKLDPYVEKQIRNLSVLNAFLDQTIFGRDKFIPVGSCVDGSKVSTPNDTGDLDILIIANKVKLKEELFHYDSIYPAFLHIKNYGEHKYIFAKSKLPLEQQYLPVRVLKNMEYLQGTSKWYFNLTAMERLEGNILKLKKNSAVGVEGSRLGSQPFQNLGVFDDYLRHRDTWKLTIPRFSNAMKYALETMQNLPALLNEHSNSYTQSDTSQLVPDAFLRVVSEALDSLSKENRKQYQNTENHYKSCNTTLVTEKEVLNGTEGNENNSTNKEKEMRFVNDLNALTSTCLTYKSNNLKDNVKDCMYTQKELPTVANKNANVRITGRQPISTVTKRQVRRDGSVDYVPAFQFEGWPRVAEEWLYRKRHWPPKWVIGNALKVGCQVVAKRPFGLCSSPERPNRDTYFRLSFALVEQELAKAMNEIQKKCWRILKAYQKAFLQSKSKVLTTYLWKNVLFWICERYHVSFWTNDNLVLGVIMCLDFMSECLEMGVLPFYFVPGMNLLKGRRVETMFQVNRKLDLIRNDPVKFLRKFLDNPPDSELYEVDLHVLENTMSYRKIADRHDDVIKQMVDAGFLETFPQFKDVDTDEFFDSVLAFKQKMIRTARESRGNTKMRDTGVHVEDAKSDEKTQAESELMNCFERMEFSKASFEHVLKAFTHCVEVSKLKDNNKHAMDLLMSLFKDSMETTLWKASQTGDEILKNTEAKWKENIESEEIAENQKQKKKTRMNLIPVFEQLLSSIKSTVLPDQKKNQQNNKAVNISDIELD